MIETKKYIRKPVYVTGVQVTEENFVELAAWCQGEIITQFDDNSGAETGKYIQVRVTNPMNPRQSQARVNDWILTSERGYKIYTPNAFARAFDEYVDSPVEVLNASDRRLDERDVGSKVWTPEQREAILARTTLNPSQGMTAEAHAQMEAAKKDGVLPHDTVVPPVDTFPAEPAVGTGPMPEQPLPGDVEQPTRPTALPENLDTEHRDPNVVYPDTPETTAAPSVVVSPQDHLLAEQLTHKPIGS